MVIIAGQEVNFANLLKAIPQEPLPTAPTEVSQQVAQSPSFIQASAVLKNILGGGELPETFRESVTTTNLINLGQASLDISAALNTVATQQNEQITALSGVVGEINERVSQQLIDLGKAAQDASSAIAGDAVTDPLSKVGDFFSGQTFGIPNALLLGGLVIGVLVLK